LQIHCLLVTQKFLKLLKSNARKNFYHYFDYFKNNIDTFSLEIDKNLQVPVIATGIAWTTDKTVKFKNPTGANPWANTIKPMNWTRSVQDLSTDPSNTGYINEDLIVWMRTAALPTFRKFYRRVNHTGFFTNSLPAGNYTLTISYSKKK
jgi:hypothetical protein